MKLIDPITDADHLSGLEPALYDIYFSNHDPNDRVKKALACTYQFIRDIRIIWADMGNLNHRKRGLILKLEMEVSTISIKKNRNQVFIDFFNTYLRIFQEFIFDLNAEIQASYNLRSENNQPVKEDSLQNTLQLKPLDNTQPIMPIKWLGTSGQLIYFFEQLKDNNFLPLNMDLQASIRKHFVDEDNKPFKNLKQSKQNYLDSKTGKPKKADVIEDITRQVKQQG